MKALDKFLHHWKEDHLYLSGKLILSPSELYRVGKLWNPHLPYLYDPKDGQFAKCCHTPPNHPCQLVLLCLYSARHFGALTLKFSLNTITTQKMARLEDPDRHWVSPPHSPRGFIVFSFFSCQCLHNWLRIKWVHGVTAGCLVRNW